MQQIRLHSGGKTLSLTAGDYRAKIVTVGAGLAELTYQGCHLVIPHNPEEMPPAHLGKVLVPWPNRIANGCYRYQGQEFQLPVNEHASRAAIHGFLAWRDWQVADAAPDNVTLTAFLPPSYGYPFSLFTTVIYSLDREKGLSVEIISENAGQLPAPYGAGIHPYLTCNLSPVDNYRVQIPAKQVFAVDSRSNPTSLHPAQELDLDFSLPRTIGTRKIDHTFKTDSCTWEVNITDPAQGLSVTLYADQPWLQIYSGEKLNRQGLAVEPMSCPPNAFNSAIDLIYLQPGKHHRLFLSIKGERQEPGVQ
ncbi:aldose-1-epimerase [Citrobacter sedlakii]